MSTCNHLNTYMLPDPWPTGESIEVCNCCGMSRAHSEWDESPWYQIPLVEARKRLQETVDMVLQSIRRPHHGGH